MTASEERKLRREQISNEIITSKEALKLLGFSRARLNQIVGDGRIIPVINGIYLKSDILAFIESRKHE